MTEVNGVGEDWCPTSRPWYGMARGCPGSGPAYGRLRPPYACSRHPSCAPLARPCLLTADGRVRRGRRGLVDSGDVIAVIAVIAVNAVNADSP